MSVLRNRVAVAKPRPPAAETPKPAPPGAWLCEPVDGWGLLTIGETTYRVAEVEYDEPNGQRRMIVKLARAGAEMEYQLSPDADGELCCDCPHAIYRDPARTCKHVVAVKAAYDMLSRRQRLDDFLDPPPLHLLDEIDDQLAALERDADDGRVPCPTCNYHDSRYCPTCDGIGEVPAVAKGGAA
jgi:hypothetical protein